MSPTPRIASTIISGQPTSDGAGVKLRRYIAGPQLPILDPFLLFDCFSSDNPNDYIAGFPEHPHRGFETVTYLVAGKMRHRDSTGREGVIEPGDIQWMRAGRGIIHSEMPEQTDGLLMGFQLWLNLPASAKMSAPGYQEYSADTIPVEVLTGGGELRVLCGKRPCGLQGPVTNADTQPLFFDISLRAGGEFTQPIPSSHSAFIYIIEGQLSIDETQHCVHSQQLAVLNAGENLTLNALEDCRLLLVAAKRLEEPVERAGPFVMNTRQELQQAFDDYRTGRFV
ncbi:MAG: pirin family protein [Pseudomonadales bacterium]